MYLELRVETRPLLDLWILAESMILASANVTSCGQSEKHGVGSCQRGKVGKSRELCRVGM